MKLCISFCNFCFSLNYKILGSGHLNPLSYHIYGDWVCSWQLLYWILFYDYTTMNQSIHLLILIWLVVNKFHCGDVSSWFKNVQLMIWFISYLFILILLLSKNISSNQKKLGLYCIVLAFHIEMCSECFFLSFIISLFPLPSFTSFILFV